VDERAQRTVGFFAVGTNMDEGRMRRWIPTARRVTIASVPGFTSTWHKRSSDGGKLAVRRTGRPDDVVWGVLYELDDLGWQQVDDAQRAAGYRAERVAVVGPDGAGYAASVYVALDEMIDDSMVPTKAYRDPIVDAARANGLPAAYVDELARPGRETAPAKDENADVTDAQREFLESCCELADGVAVGEGAFAPGPALWVGTREVAHFDDERTLDVRLTKPEIRRRRTELEGDARVSLRRNTSDWLEITMQSDEDLGWATGMVLAAIASNRSTARPGLPPTGAELDRRRRFH
jgi:hypothetical protein